MKKLTILLIAIMTLASCRQDVVITDQTEFLVEKTEDRDEATVYTLKELEPSFLGEVRVIIVARRPYLYEEGDTLRFIQRNTKKPWQRR